MAIRLSRVKEIVRGAIVDRLSTGITPAFSDAEVLSAINVTKGGFFGMRPEAFCVGTVLIAPPVDFPSPPDVISIECPEEPEFAGDYVLAGMRWELDADHALWHDTLWYLSDGVAIYTASDYGLNVPPTTFTRVLDYPVSIEVTGTVLTETLAHTGKSEEGRQRWAGDTAILAYTAGIFNLTFAPDQAFVDGTDGSGMIPAKTGWVDSAPVDVTLVYTVGATSTATVTSFTVGQTTTTPAQWIADAEVPIAEWAVTQFCYGVAAFLLMQRGKDAFYREAAASLQKLYVGR